ncbi:MlaD family protein [Nocardioides pelophilus]|uniref:MlaD family protein n=1 Tax=Nocardioides pelophilus TaxID=2172019 RepID=UPI001604562C|nr:MlaD family protein [Nocardioides pelophilus]
MSAHVASGQRMAPAAARVRLVVVISVLVVLGLFVTGSLLVAGPDTRLMLRASFTDASPLLEGNDVRLGGVKVGQVVSMRLQDDSTEVTIELEKEALPVHADARLTIRPVTLLGERYLELDRGSEGAPVLADGSRLDLEQTGSSVALDEVLGSLDDPTSASLAALIGTLGTGMDGNGDDVQRLIAALAPALGDTRKLASVLSRQNEELGSLVASFAKVASGIAVDDGRQLDRLVAATTAVLQQTEVNEAAFRSMLEELPDTLRAATRTLGNLQGTADAAAPTLAALRPTTRNLEAISAELLRFADAADPALASANPVLEKAQALVAEALPIARLLRQNTPALRDDVEALDPITRTLTSDLTSVMEFVRGWALTTNGRDGLSHYFRAAFVLSEYSVTGLLPNGIPTTTPTTGDAAPTDGTDDPRQPLAPQDSPPLLSGLDDDVNNLVDSLLSPRTDRTGGVTGLEPRQEARALQFLLGGA